MLVSIILFLALVLLLIAFLSIFVKFVNAIISKKSFNLMLELFLLTLSAALFSYLFYLTH